MKLFFSFCTTLVSFLLLSCSTYKVEGTTSVPLLNGKKLYIKVPDNNDVVILDSCEIVHGSFNMKGDVDSIMLGAVYVGGESLMPIVIESGTIIVSIENKGLEVKGTPLNERLYNFIKEKALLEQRLSDASHREIQMIMDGVPTDEVETTTKQELKTLTDEMNGLIVEFVTDNFDNLLSTQIFVNYCQSFPHPIMTPAIQKIVENAPSDFKEHSFVKEYLQKANEKD